MSRLLPPPHLLRALVTVARTLSVARAAEALHLTPGAVSKQLAELERRLDAALLDRSGQRLRLTAAGSAYVERVAPLLDALEQAALELIAGRAAADTRAVLNLAMVPTFGERWLIPRLGRFLAAHPAIELRFVRYADSADLAATGLDCAIRYGRPPWPEGVEADYLAGHEVVVIVAPREAARLREPADVRAFALLHHASEPQAWSRWLAHHGLAAADAAPLPGPRMDLVSAQVRAVASGIGIALVPRCLAEDELRRGDVVAAPFPLYRQKTGYHLCLRRERAAEPALQAFRTWLRAESAREAGWAPDAAAAAGPR